MNIVIIGSGYVGTTAAALFSISGHNVTAIDLDPKKVAQINSGKAPFYEAGLDRIIAAGVEKGTLTATSSYDTVSSADVIFSCVGTPDNPDGSSNLSYVYGAAEEAAKYIKEGAIFVQKSTVPVGTGRKVIKLLPDSVSYVSNPEFLRESTAVYDTLFFDRVVAGGDNQEANKAILDLHKTVEGYATEIARIADISVDLERLEQHTGKYVSTRLESAELIKVTANAFLALKISFANSIAQVSDASGADINEVMSAVGSDKRIGKAFFNAGRGYGGGCFPKDVSGLISSGLEFGVDLDIMQAAQELNESMPGYIINRIKENQNDTLKDKNIALLGLAFKSGTSDARKSPAIKLADLLINEGASVTAYDPQAMEEAREHYLADEVVTVNSINEALKHAEIVLIATDWTEFKYVTEWVQYAPHMNLLVDAVNCVSEKDVATLSVPYLSVGRAVSSNA